MPWELTKCIKMSKRTPKNHKNWHNTPVVLCWPEKKIESNKRQWISFRPQRWDVPYRNHPACCEKLWFVRSIYPNLPQMGQKFTTACWCRSMIACQVSWISDEFWIYSNLKTRYLNVLPAINNALVFEIHSHLWHGTWKFTQGHTCDFSTNFGALEHVLGVQIWIMHIKFLETQLMYKKGQTNPKKNSKMKHNTPICSVLTLEFFWKQ